MEERKAPSKVVIHHHSLFGRVGSSIRVKKQGSFSPHLNGELETICFTDPIIPAEFRIDLDFANIHEITKEIC